MALDSELWHSKYSRDVTLAVEWLIFIKDSC